MRCTEQQAGRSQGPYTAGAAISALRATLSLLLSILTSTPIRQYKGSYFVQEETKA